MKKDAATSLVEMPSKSIIEAEGLLKRAIDRWENEGGGIVPPIIVCGSIDNLRHPILPGVPETIIGQHEEAAGVAVASIGALRGNRAHRIAHAATWKERSSLVRGPDGCCSIPRRGRVCCRANLHDLAAESLRADLVIPIQKINEAYDRLLKSDVKCRFVIDMASLKQAG